MTSDDASIHGGEHDTFADTERALRRKIAALEAERTTADKDLAEWAHRAGWATGHGETLPLMIEEMRSCQVEQDEQLRAELAEAREQIPHTGDGSCDQCGSIPSVDIPTSLCPDCLDETVTHNELRAELASERARVDFFLAHDASIMRGGIIERRKGNDPKAYYVEWIEEGSLDIVTQSKRYADGRKAIDSAMADEAGEEK